MPRLRTLFALCLALLLAAAVFPAQAEEALTIATVNGRDPAGVKLKAGSPIMATGTADPTVSAVVADAGDSAFVEVGNQARLVGSAVGGAGPYSFRWTASDGELRDADGPAVTFDATGVEPGTVTVTLTATDSAGNAGTDTVKVAVYEYSQATLLDVTGDVGVGIPDELIFQAAGGNADRQSSEHRFDVPAGGRDLRVELDWGIADNDFDLMVDGEGLSSETAGASSAKPEVLTEATPARDYLARVNAYLTVPDSWHLTATAEVPPADPRPRLAPLNPFRFEVGQPQLLEATSSGGTGAVQLTWDLDGNGSYETSGAQASTTFPLGTHLVTVKATDEAGFEVRETIPVRVVPPGSQLASPHFVVIAINDTGINPYHRDFSAATYPDRAVHDATAGFTRHPSEYLPGYPSEAEALPVTLGEGFMPKADCPSGNGTLAGRCAGGLWTSERIEPGKLYWIPGTKIIGAITYDPDTHPILDDSGHGTEAASVSAGNTYGSCPSCLIVFDEGFGSEWASRQPWIDFVSNSYGNINLAPDTPVNLLSNRVDVKEAVESGQTWLFASGNGHGNAFVIPNTSYTQPADGPDWIMRVGAVDSGNRQPVIGDGMPADVSSFGTGPLPSAKFDSADAVDSFSGTSAATPVTSGVFGLILRAARAELGDHRAGPRGEGVIAQGTPVEGSPYLGDGVLTRAELWELGLKTAKPGSYPNTDVSLFAATYPADEVRYLFEGYGIADEASAALAIAVMLGDVPLPERPEEDEFFALDSALRVELYGSWSGYEEQYGTSEGADGAATGASRFAGVTVDDVDKLDEAVAVLDIAGLAATGSTGSGTTTQTADRAIASEGSSPVSGQPFLTTSAADGGIDPTRQPELAVAGNAGTRAGTETLRRYPRRADDGAGGCAGKEYLADEPGTADAQCTFTAQAVTVAGQGFGNFENSFALEAPLPIRLDAHRPVTGSLNVGGAGVSPDSIFLVGLRTGGAIMGWQRVSAPYAGTSVVKIPFSFPISPRFANVDLDRVEFVVGLRRSSGLLREQLNGPDATFVDLPLAPAATRAVQLTVDGVDAGTHPIDERDGTWGTNLDVTSLSDGTHTIAATELVDGVAGRSEQITLEVARADNAPVIEMAVFAADGSLAVDWAAGRLDAKRERWMARSHAPSMPGDYRLVIRLVVAGEEINRSASVPLTVVG